MKEAKNFSQQLNILRAGVLASLDNYFQYKILIVELLSKLEWTVILFSFITKLRSFY